MECRNCDSKNTKVLFTKGAVPYFKCLSCHVCFSGKTLTGEETKELYKYYSSTASIVSKKLNQLRYDTLFDRLAQYKKTSRLLDIGCGRGEFLKAAEKNGWKAIGSEFSQEAIELCKRDNLEVVSGKLSEVNFPENHFDVICMQEVIEHIDEKPEEIFNEISRILRPGGVLYLTTPNFNGITRRLIGSKWRAFHVEHRFVFTPHVLRKILEKSGFRVCLSEASYISLNEIKDKMLSSVSVDSVSSRQKEQVLRAKIEKNKLLNMAKHVVNRLLIMFGCGDSILIIAEKIRKH